MRSRRNVVDAPRQRADRCAVSSITLVTMPTRRSTRRWFSPFFCATVSVALGAAYTYAAGAPSHYLLVNFSALAAGLLAASIVRSALVLNQQVVGTFTVAVGLVLLATALVGHGVDGASRWVRIAGISFQPSLILLPLVVVLFAGNRSWLSSTGLLLAGAALAFQPDRAVAGALTAALAVQWVYRRDAWVTLSVIGAGLPFFGSAFGLKPPFRVNFRFPAWTTVGFSAVAIPATATASAAPRAMMEIKRLRMCSISLLCGLAVSAPAIESLGLSLQCPNYQSRNLDKPRHSQKRAA